MANRPSNVNLRVYNVGFGDCALLTFQYPTLKDRNVLIDFGSSATKSGKITEHLRKVAHDIVHVTGGTLDVVVATHRHSDHIKGFTTDRKGTGPGDILLRNKASLIVQPWTEDPDAATTAKHSTHHEPAKMKTAFVGALASMQDISGHILDETQRRGSSLSTPLRRQLGFYGQTNIANRSAVEKLMSSGKKYRYVRANDRLAVGDILPGVKVSVLGPPDLTQTMDVKKQRSTDADEFWHLMGFWSMLAGATRDAATRPGNPFRTAENYPFGQSPPDTRWLVRRLRSLRGRQLLSIVRALDSALNNTSVILLIQVGNKKFLFPGDAQIENWAYSLGRKSILGRLAGVDVYKVGHHGSLNATPKTLWYNFRKREERKLRTFLSTMKGKHGTPRKKTEVPRRTLVDAMKKESDFFSTEDLKGKSFYRDFEIY